MNLRSGGGTAAVDGAEHDGAGSAARLRRKIAEEALGDTERTFRSFADAIPTLAWMANADGYITWFNRRWYEYTGTTPSQMEGWGWQSVHDRAVLPAVMERWQSSIQSGKQFEMVFPLRGADGVFRSFLTRISPVRDQQGRLTQWVGINTEVDELQRTQEALRQSEERMRLALNAVAGMGTFDWNVTADRLHFDERMSRLFGFDPRAASEFPLAQFLQTVHAEDRERIERAVAATVETGKDYSQEYRVLLPDGELRWISAQGSCYFDAEGRPLRFLGVGLDITQRKLTEEALVRSEKLAAVGRLSASIAHEINNPLEAVTNLLYLSREAESLGEVKSYLDTAEQELLRVSAICSQTLRFHRQSTRPGLTACEDLFTSVLSIYQGKLRNYPIAIEKRMRATKPVRCFEGEIRQVISNLVGNAIDAMAPGAGRLLLRSRDATLWSDSGGNSSSEGTRGIVLSVADTGPGMSGHTARRAFEPFFTTKEVAGTGLGLWISKEIVTRHNGAMRFRSSQRPGRSGTVFTVFLPFEAADRE